MKRSSFILKAKAIRTLSGISLPFGRLSQIQGQVTHALLTRSPLYFLEQARGFSFDLHVLGTPPAFILSQDQTLHLKYNEGLRDPFFTFYFFSSRPAQHHYLVFKEQILILILFYIAVIVKFFISFFKPHFFNTKKNYYIF